MIPALRHIVSVPSIISDGTSIPPSLRSYAFICFWVRGPSIFALSKRLPWRISSGLEEHASRLDVSVAVCVGRSVMNESLSALDVIETSSFALGLPFLRALGRLRTWGGEAGLNLESGLVERVKNSPQQNTLRTPQQNVKSEPKETTGGAQVQQVSSAFQKCSVQPF